MSFQRQVDIEDFLDKLLRSREYDIDPRANDIPYGKSNLAQELRNALTDYEDSKAFSSGTAFPLLLLEHLL